jgi:long-chain fatty acid transport protein
MKRTSRSIAAALAGTSIAALTAVMATSASAGGFAIREQSVESQGASFAGSAAFGGLSSMYWNPAAAANKDGLNFDSNYSVILPKAEITTKAGTSPLLNGLSNDSGDIGRLALVPASYANYQFVNYDPNLYLGLAINSPFGLATEPENENYKGAVLGRTSKLFTVNVNPNLAYKIGSGLTIGAGLQIMKAEGTFKFAALAGRSTLFPGSAGFEGSSFAVGGTAGLTYVPVAGTTIGLGYRSRMTEKLEGNYFSPALGALGGTTRATVDVNLPDIVTLSFKQNISNSTRLLGTAEWTNWSRFDELRIKPLNAAVPQLAIPANWSDGWFFSLGAEHDYSNGLTLRTGLGYEISPVDDPTKRISGVPDSDRIWASIGASYKWTETTTLDFAYTHVFLKDASIDRLSTQNLRVIADTTASTDIVSVGMKMKFGGAPALK